jgi:SlyX protein
MSDMPSDRVQKRQGYTHVGPAGLQIYPSRTSVGTRTEEKCRMEEDKLIEIETKLAHQEHTIAELNEALTDQQSQISNLDAQVRALMDRVRAMSDAMPGEQQQDERPPHY